MAPKTKHKYLGIEIECLSHYNIVSVNNIYNKLKLRDIMTIGNDSSINANWTYFGYEFRILTRERDLSKNMNRIATFLRKINAITNESCGLHVHVDCRERPFLEVFTNLVNKQDLLFKLIPHSRQINTYCKKTKISDILESARHLAINPRAYKEHKTVEVRLHEGTVDCEEIENWCNLLVSMVDKKPLTKSQKSYVRKRTRMFA